MKNRLNIPFQVCKIMYKFWMLSHELRKLPSYLLSSQFLSLPLFFLHHLFSPTLYSTGLAPVVKTLDSTIHLINNYYPLDKYRETNCIIHWWIVFIHLLNNWGLAFCLLLHFLLPFSYHLPFCHPHFLLLVLVSNFSTTPSSRCQRLYLLSPHCEIAGFCLVPSPFFSSSHSLLLFS